MDHNVEETAAPEPKPMKFGEMVPDHWFTDRARSSLWVVGYRMLRVPEPQLEIAQILELEHVCVVLLRGGLSYLDSAAASIDIISEFEFRFDASSIKLKDAPAGTYALFMTPHDVDGEPGVESVTRDRIRDAVGLFGTLYGRNCVYQRLFDNVIDLGEDKSSTFSPILENPHWFAEVDFSEGGLARVQQTNVALMRLPEADKNRVYLALRWLQSALYEQGGVSGFLQYWVALETLAMPDTTNIRPMNQLLADAYGLTVEEAQQRFLMGRLFNLRSEIVHNGRIVPIHAMLLRFVEAVFADLLAAVLGLPCEGRAASVLADPECDLPAYLQVPR